MKNCAEIAFPVKNSTHILIEPSDLAIKTGKN